MTHQKPLPLKRLPTGVRNLDDLLCGGIPENSLIVIGGVPGAGKTILAQQMALKSATPERPVIFFQTLSESTVKILRYIQSFSFFDSAQLDSSAHFIDLGSIIRTKGLQNMCELMMEHVRKIQPGLVVIDSFKVFADLAASKEELRKFSYKILTDLVAWECTTFLLGEFTSSDIESNPLFSIVDGIIILSTREISGEQQRILQILKLRGTDHDRGKHPMVIGSDGIELYAPRVVLGREEDENALPEPVLRRTGISTFDSLIGKGIASGSACLVSGASGTGRTLFLLEFLYRGAAQFGEKGIYFSFDESRAELIEAARGLGMDLAAEIARGMIEIVEIAQPDILVERDMVAIHDRIKQSGAQRIAIDCLSAFFHKIKDVQIIREKIFQLTRIMHQANAIAFFASDVGHGSSQLSYFGVEETVVDGIILLSAVLEGAIRQRYVEVYKLRLSNHLSGRHKMAIKSAGFEITPGGPS